MNLSALNLKQDLDEVLALPESSRWKLEIGSELEVLFTFCSARAPQDLFQARLLWGVYPGEPPSLKFRDIKSGAQTAQSWPQNVPGFRPDSQDACLNICSEGFALHGEWKNDPRYRWNTRGNVLLSVLRELQLMLDTHYFGRAVA